MTVGKVILPKKPPLGFYVWNSLRNPRESLIKLSKHYFDFVNLFIVVKYRYGYQKLVQLFFQGAEQTVKILFLSGIETSRRILHIKNFEIFILGNSAIVISQFPSLEFIGHWGGSHIIYLKGESNRDHKPNWHTGQSKMALS